MLSLDLVSSSFNLSNGVPNGVFLKNSKMVMKIDDPLAAKTQPFKDKVKAQNS